MEPGGVGGHAGTAWGPSAPILCRPRRPGFVGLRSILAKLEAQTTELLEGPEEGNPRKQGKCAERRRIQAVCCQ